MHLYWCAHTWFSIIFLMPWKRLILFIIFPAASSVFTWALTKILRLFHAKETDILYLSIT